MAAVTRVEPNASCSSRPLSRHERYSLVRRHIGTQSVLTYVVTVDGACNDVPSAKALQNRMIQLAKLYPILTARIANAWSNKPILMQTELAEDDISRRIISKQLDSTTSTHSESNSVKLIFEECPSWGFAMDPEKGDLWRVGRFHQPETSEVSIVLCVDHILSDGRGALNLLPLLLNPLPPTSDDAPSLPPALEEKVNIKPSLRTLIKVIMHALILPKLPSWLLPGFLLPTSYWPYDTAPKDVQASSKAILPLEAKTGVLAGRWTASQLADLNTIFNAEQRPITAQGIIAACAMSALWLADQEEVSRQDGTGLSIKLTTPTSERKANLDHPDVLGNYVGTVETECLLNAEANIIEVARQYSAEIQQAKVESTAPKAWGLLDYIDDPDMNGEDTSDLTGWDKFFLEKAASSTPFGASLEVSNIGLSPMLDDRLQPYVKSLNWMQSPTGVGSAVNINVVGCRPRHPGARYGDLHFSVTWKRDAAPGKKLSQAWVDKYMGFLEMLPNTIVALHAQSAPVQLGTLRDKM